MPANIKVFPKSKVEPAESEPGSTRPGGGLGMDRRIEKRRFTPRRIALGAAVLLLAGLCGYGLLADFGVRKLNVQRDRLTLSTVELAPFLEYIPVRGTVLPLRTVYLDALESGQVVQVFAEEGAQVAEGDPLLRLANPDLELTILQQEAGLERSREALLNGRLTMEQKLLASRKGLMEIEYRLAVDQRNFERYQDLPAEDLAAIMSRQEYERLRDEYEYSARRMALTRQTLTQDSLLAASKVVQLVSAVERTGRDLQIVGRRLDNLTVRAPVAGQLTTLEAEVGESKGTGVRFGQIDMTGGFKVRAAIDEHYIGRVGRGQRGSFDSGGETYGLVIRKVYPEVREGRFEVDLVFEGEAPRGDTPGPEPARPPGAGQPRGGGAGGARRILPVYRGSLGLRARRFRRAGDAAPHLPRAPEPPGLRGAGGTRARGAGDHLELRELRRKHGRAGVAVSAP